MVIGSSSCPYISHATPYISSLTRSLSSLRVTWFTMGTSRRHCSTSLVLVRREREEGKRGRGREEGGRGREEGKRGRGREGDREGQDLCMLLRLNFKTMSLFIFIILFQDIFVRNMITQLTFFLMLLTSVKDRPQLQQVILQCIHNILHNIVIHAFISFSLFLKDLLAIESDVAPIDLSENYLKSRQCLDTKSECERILGGVEKDGVGNKRRRTRGKYATNFFWQVREREGEKDGERSLFCTFIAFLILCVFFFLFQLFVVMIRSIINLARNPMTSFVQVHIQSVLNTHTRTLLHYSMFRLFIFLCAFSSS